LQSHFHIISTSRLMSWTTFQPRGSSSTIEDSPSSARRRSRTTQRGFKTTRTTTLDYNVLGLVRHTPQVLMQGRKKTDSY
jgi:hypothetical protein